jgi:2-C-methyl-D-erythritol 4-phosphate cytidylyltransferase/2-C-methyl-D-erythritol 2,4-cyclodiphosphate synthase
VPKQYLELAGVPVLARAIAPFLGRPDVTHVVVVLPAADAAAPPTWLASQAGSRLSIVAGGVTRSDSVAAGLVALPAACVVVLVHDGARPFVTTALIDRVAATARTGVAVMPALALTDTIKEVDPADTGRVIRTVERDLLRSVQTPQGFPRAMLEEASRRARADQVSGTDDGSLVERLGGTVRLVPGEEGNLKITTRNDLILAEYLAAQAR